MSTLITASNSAQAQQLKSLINTDDIVLGDYHDIPDFMVKSGKLIKTPNPNSPAFIHEMLALCLDKGINKVFPLRRQELLLLSEATLLFSEFDIKLYVPEKELISDNSDQTTKGGELIIIENGKIIAGSSSYADSPLPTGESWRGADGVYKGSQIFTAD